MRVHGLVEALFPGSYHAEGRLLAERTDAALVATFQYFSTVTATTVGFGDVVPVAPVARVVTGLEAIVGQLYLAVGIATLVGRVVAADGEAGPGYISLARALPPLRPRSPAL